jgi:hypothetical protein
MIQITQTEEEKKYGILQKFLRFSKDEKTKTLVYDKLVEYLIKMKNDPDLVKMVKLTVVICILDIKMSKTPYETLIWEEIKKYDHLLNKIYNEDEDYMNAESKTYNKYKTEVLDFVYSHNLELTF